MMRTEKFSQRKIRNVISNDAEELAEIYNHYIENTIITFLNLIDKKAPLIEAVLRLKIAAASSRGFAQELK